ncbi:DUF302 domain-containing protein [Magnetospira sp. QH-2]|uniref:DUF302 domain-containing protein n=1 Tax=Magnetospira sp. (strain QH-2) TaxID=1288970 RepID=UPI0003E80E84|nr:DUF302 domain-containing protein [Magnetospira sp. QH-2]CCQ73019.1 conserved exported protein of unknown function [Magnetospira sp. QH-2]
MNGALKLIFALVLLAAGAAGGLLIAMNSFEIKQTVVMQQVAEGLTAEDVRESMMSKAAELNMKFVGHQPLSTELNNRGVKSAQLDIYQFCNPEDARKMVDVDMSFAAYMPCRIILVEDPEGRLWLEMLDLDLMIQFAKLEGEVLDIAIRVRDTLVEIMDSAAKGDF